MKKIVKNIVDVKNLECGAYLAFQYDGRKPRTYFKFEKYGIDDHNRKCIEGVSVNFECGAPKSKFDIGNKEFDMCWEATNWPSHGKMVVPPYSDYIAYYKDLFGLECTAERGEIRYATPEEIEFIERIISRREYMKNLEKKIPDELVNGLYKEISNSDPYLECHDEETYRKLCRPYVYKVIKQKTGYSKGSEIAEMIYLKLGIEEEFDSDESEDY